MPVVNSIAELCALMNLELNPSDKPYASIMVRIFNLHKMRKIPKQQLRMYDIPKPTLHYTLALYYEYWQNKGRVIKHYRIAHSGNHPHAAIRLGLYYWKTLNDWNTAHEWYNCASDAIGNLMERDLTTNTFTDYLLDLIYQNPVDLCETAKIEIKSGNNSCALEYLVLARDMGWPGAYAELGDYYLDQNDEDTAVTYITQYVEMGNPNMSDLLRISHYYVKRRDIPKAIAYFTQTLDLLISDQFANINCWRGILYGYAKHLIKFGMRAEAEQAFVKYCKIFNEYTDLHAILRLYHNGRVVTFIRPTRLYALLHIERHRPECVQAMKRLCAEFSEVNALDQYIKKLEPIKEFYVCCDICMSDEPVLNLGFMCAHSACVTCYEQCKHMCPTCRFIPTRTDDEYDGSVTDVESDNEDDNYESDPDAVDDEPNDVHETNQ